MGAPQASDVKALCDIKAVSDLAICTTLALEGRGTAVRDVEGGAGRCAGCWYVCVCVCVCVHMCVCVVCVTVKGCMCKCMAWHSYVHDHG